VAASKPNSGMGAAWGGSIVGLLLLAVPARGRVGAGIAGL